MLTYSRRLPLCQASDPDGTNLFFSNVCGYSNTRCPPPYDTGNNYGVVREATNPNVCFPLAHASSPAGWQLLNPSDATVGVSMRYVNGEYSGCDGQQPRQINQLFQCGVSAGGDPFLSVQSVNGNHCNFTGLWRTPHACPTVTHFPIPRPPPSKGLSGGSIFCISLLVAIVLYVGGSMGLNYSRGARGWQQLKPHPAFWAWLAALVADGVRFTVLQVRARCSATARAEANASDYHDIDRPRTGSDESRAAGASGGINGGYGAQEEQAPPAERVNYLAHFASDRDEIGGHAPLTPAAAAHATAMQPLYDEVEDAPSQQQKKQGKKGGRR